MGIKTEWRGECQPDERTAAVRGGRKEGRMVPKRGGRYRRTWEIQKRMGRTLILALILGRWVGR